MAKCLRCGAGPEWLDMKDRPPKPRPNAEVLPLILELAAAQSAVAKVCAMDSTRKGWIQKRDVAALRQAKAIIALCDLVRPSAGSET